MSDFSIAYRRTNAYEGDVLANARSDRGGETFAGISRVRHPKWGGWPIVDRTIRHHVRPTGPDLANLWDLHRKFFLDEFWMRTAGDTCPDQDIANEVYDSAVNCGVGRSVEWLQQALNVCNRRGTRWPDIRVDGVPGAETQGAVARAISDPTWKWLLLQVIESFQRAHYVTLAATDPTQEDNVLGWFRLRVQHTSPPP